MKLQGYHTPKTLEETLSILDAEAKRGRSAAVLAGGTDVMVRMREGRMRPEVLVQIEALSDLAAIDESAAAIRLGARVSFAQLMTSKVIAQHAEVLALASRDVGAPQIQSRGTIGGQLGTASPVGDLLPPLVALEAEVIARSVDGERRVPVESWLRGVGVCDRRPNELIMGVEFRKVSAATRSLWHKAGPRRAQSISKVSFAALIRLSAERRVEHIRLVFGAVAVTAKRAAKTEALLAGQVLTPALIQQAQQTAMMEFTPITDLRSTDAYRRRMVGVMLRRGLVSLL
ncbi:MAG: FAD binding domain-containing protein [Candidatus Sumerlaeia bacterium]|nr:FAD binding domain-containing protein [Candidatus Sumerlaeia bacterium]